MRAVTLASSTLVTLLVIFPAIVCAANDIDEASSAAEDRPRRLRAMSRMLIFSVCSVLAAIGSDLWFAGYVLIWGGLYGARKLRAGEGLHPVLSARIARNLLAWVVSDSSTTELAYQRIKRTVNSCVLITCLVSVAWLGSPARVHNEIRRTTRGTGPAELAGWLVREIRDAVDQPNRDRVDTGLRRREDQRDPTSATTTPPSQDVLDSDATLEELCHTATLAKSIDTSAAVIAAMDHKWKLAGAKVLGCPTQSGVPGGPGTIVARLEGGDDGSGAVVGVSDPLDAHAVQIPHLALLNELVARRTLVDLTDRVSTGEGDFQVFELVGGTCRISYRSSYESLDTLALPESVTAALITIADRQGAVLGRASREPVTSGIEYRVQLRSNNTLSEATINFAPETGRATLLTSFGTEDFDNGLPCPSVSGLITRSRDQASRIASQLRQ